MADTFPAILVGGPCEGVVRQVTADQLSNGRVWCKGQLYILVAGGAGDYKYAFQYQPDLVKAEHAGSELSAMRAWSRWMHALGHKGPHAHNRIQRATVRARRITHKR